MLLTYLSVVLMDKENLIGWRSYNLGILRKNETLFEKTKCQRLQRNIAQPKN